LLIPGSRQPQRFIPGRKLHGTGAGTLAERHRQHLQEDTVDVVLRLLLGQAEAVDLHAIAEAPELRIIDTVALLAISSQSSAKARILPHLGDELEARIDEEADAADHLRELRGRHLARGTHGVEHADAGCQREGQFLHRRRPCFLQVIGAYVSRIPLRHLAIGELITSEVKRSEACGGRCRSRARDIP